MDVFTLLTQKSVIGFIIITKVILGLFLMMLKIWDVKKEKAS
jgi:hypothetical protein